jgi:alpha-mannosidase
MRLSLLRSPTSPDREADQGEHRFTYSLLPHTGRWDERTVAAAYAINDPLLVHVSPGRSAAEPESTRDESGPVASLVSVDAENVVIETVKQAEDGAAMIVRLYETQRRRGVATLTVGVPIEAAWRTNLLEETSTALEVRDNQVRLMVKPYEIVTLRLVTQAPV